MKTISAILSIFLIQAFFGCRESLINQPESADRGSKDGQYISPVNAEKSIYSPNDLKGEINICCASFDPLSGECKIMGKVTYLYNILEYSGNNTRIKLDLEMDAELCTKLMNPARYRIYGTSTDTLLLSSNGKLLLDKTYGVQYRSDLRLCVQYEVTTEGVSIMQLNLLQIVD